MQNHGRNMRAHKKKKSMHTNVGIGPVWKQVDGFVCAVWKQVDGVIINPKKKYQQPVALFTF